MFRLLRMLKSGFVALVCVTSFQADADDLTLTARDRLVVQTVLRLKDFDLQTSPAARASVMNYLRAEMGTDQSFELIERFLPVEIAPDLIGYCLKHPGETSGVRGAELLFKMKQEEMLQAVAADPKSEAGSAAVSLLGFVAGQRAVDLLSPLVTEPKLSSSVRTAAVTGLGRTKSGREFLLGLVTQQTLPADLKFVTANILLSAEEDTIRRQAGQHLQLPATADAQPLPTVAELVKRTGKADAGAQVFRTVGTCINCHKVRGDGKEVGPDLSEIGTKLSKDALYVSILDPSAAISHNFESYLLITVDGLSFSGLLISDTSDSVTIRSREGIDRKFPRDSIEEFEKQKLSLMPQDLQKLLTIQQLVDLVEYLTTLKKPEA